MRDNLNTPRALARLQELKADPAALKAAGDLLGLLQDDPRHWFQGDAVSDALWIDVKIAERDAAKKVRDFATADAIRDTLKAQGIILEDGSQGTTWRKLKGWILATGARMTMNGWLRLHYDQ